jgi:hypothetical protein
MPELEGVTPVQTQRSHHEVAIAPPPGEYVGNEIQWELNCDVCGYLGAAESETTAWAIADRHRSIG